ncbi:HNH endonuclease signature motif containing protein [Haliea salexigens]|uniref:HNH endonuclease n=1 Tax=Haliea salexigens TaxID=287487 RepID=UPI000A046EC2
MPTSPRTHSPRYATAPRHKGPARASSAVRGYGAKWRQARAGYLAKHPICLHCERRGMVTTATDVDHIIPHKGDMRLFWDSSNWQPLCKRCHSTKTAAEDGGFGNRGGGGSIS